MATGRRKASKAKKEETNWQERVIQIRRVSKVVKGGKKLSFRAIVIVGNERGQVGVGVGKASDVIGAVKKGVADGKKHLIEIPITKSNSIPHPIDGVGGGAKVIMRPAAPGTGVIAGGPVRAVLECAGITDVLTKSLGSNNPINMVHATATALKNLEDPAAIAARRGLPLERVAPAAIIRAMTTTAGA